MGAGVVLAASFPKIGIAGFAWIAPALILLSAIGKSPKQTFRIGYAAGFAHYLVSLYWLLLIPVTGFPILGWFALAVYLSLYPALWVWLSWRMFPARMDSSAGTSTFQAWSEQFLSVPWSRRMAWCLFSAAVWVALEMTIARLFSGFPWNLLGSSQYKITPLIQIASITGIYGVAFLAVWTSLSILCAVMVIIRKPTIRSAWIGEIILPAAVLLALYGSGYHKLVQPERQRPELKVALIQPSIPQTEIWDRQESSNRFRQLIELSGQALTNEVDLMIWPEAAVPGLIRMDDDISQPILDLARKHKVWIIIGADDFKPHPGAVKLSDSDFYNSSFLVSPEGEFVASYRKRNLVIFGEYIPLAKWLPFMKYLTIITGSFTPGDRVVPYFLTDLHTRISPLICFEDVFPDLVPEYVSEDTDFLVNLTNNGWFGEGAAQWQHAAAAVFRTVENGVPLVRACNNGLTCWIDSAGRMRQIFRDAQGSIYGPGFMLARIPLLEPGEKRIPTFYHQHGDLFGWTCVGITVIQLLRVLLQNRKVRRAGTTQPVENTVDKS
ncbi:apolipoprotein N-acyltransferase [Pedosphaera parvula Ellin514]|uniref:Apolipoprotein N-acyltransferase n=2 Tax=Pedosphaera TaxID=1032526 RepID=B9XIY6_PEDPL|nr:apolipoprotein N-acyltransferase [Pedosphaera parvula Ellin514]